MNGWNKINRTQGDLEIPGVILVAFIHNGGTYYLTQIYEYQDEMIDCWGLVNFEEFTRKVQQGWVVTTLPENAQVSVYLLTGFTVTNVQAWVKEDEFIKEVADLINELNGRPTTIDRCKKIYQLFQEEQSEAARQALKEAYEAVPEHKRDFILQDMDIKDIPLRMVIYGEDEIENWSHRIVSRQKGINPLPTISVKGALKKKK